MKAKKLINSFNYAFQGIIYTLRTQRNMRIHVSIATIVLIMSLFFRLNRWEMMILFVTITMVIACEMVNTAVEATVDLMTDQYNIFAKIAKNVAAGAVLVTSINAVIIGYLLFAAHLNPASQQVIFAIRESDVHITFIVFIVVTVLIIGIKVYFGKGTPLSGGMPSGHAALAFSAATAISLITANILVSGLSLFLALLVSQSRVEGKIHNLLEVLVGAILGILMTTIIFQLLVS
ncbi:diacylglycerol kinase [Tindallia californiensis]|uniref:Diacylglycerol kinase (ATP) n=1 Tax=Tindallia californiensis TaxID=159292 RepID=A0A1H3ITJ5_9FIRM|nr:diacylglycerol kinase [Tindallia californiensis]SDY30589.1 diacylglycerol kinase (ATP) [Tindallia californiensis]